MILSNYHSHFNLCDGKGEAHEYLDQAIKLGFSAYGFSAHAPIAGESWTLKDEDLAEYLTVVANLKKEYAGRIQVYTGLEIDYIPDISGPSSEKFTSLDLDYTIGSVHMLECAETGEFLAVDGPDEMFLSLLEKTFSGSFRDFSDAYYGLVRRMLEEHRFNILGHIDLIKKKNRKFGYLNEKETWYRDQVLETLDTAAEKDVIVEINTGGIARGATDRMYPSDWIVKECRNRNIPMMVNADSHNPLHIDFYFQEAYKMLKECGYSEVRILLDGKWQDVQI